MQRSMIQSSPLRSAFAARTPLSIPKFARRVRVASAEPKVEEQATIITEDASQTSSMGNQTAAYGEIWGLILPGAILSLSFLVLPAARLASLNDLALIKLDKQFNVRII